MSSSNPNNETGSSGDARGELTFADDVIQIQVDQLVIDVGAEPSGNLKRGPRWGGAVFLGSVAGWGPWGG